MMKLTIPKTEIQNKTAETILTWAAALLLYVFFGLTLSSMAGFPVRVVLVVLLVLFPVFHFLAGRVKLIRKYQMFYCLMAAALVLLFGYTFFSNAFLLLINRVGDAVNAQNGFVLVPFYHEVPAGREQFYLRAAAAVLFYVTSMVCVSGARKRRWLAALLATGLPILLGLLLKLQPLLVLLVLYLAALLFFLIHCLRAKGLAPQMMASAAAVLFLLLVWLTGYSGSAFVEQQRVRAGDWLRATRFAPETETAGMPKGNLNGAGSLDYDGNVVFDIALEHPSELYLRSYTGSVFSGGAWSALPDSAYNGSFLGMNEWLADKGFYPYASLSLLYALDAGRTGSSAQTGAVTVSNHLAYSDQLYLPYETVVTEDLQDLGTLSDQGFSASGWKGVRDYSLETYASIFRDYGSMDLADWRSALEGLPGYAEYLEAEKVYRSFVYDNYLAVDPAYNDVLDRTGLTGLQNARYVDTTYQIRKYFEDNFQYSEVLSDRGKTDPLVYFAETARSGYDAQFATLAALLYRRDGIPARYMEGWYLSPKEMDAYRNNENVSFEVSDSAAHAWVEIYEDGIGWVPVEVTPGYYTLEESETQEQTPEMQKIQKKNDDIYFDTEEVAPDSAPQTEAETSMAFWQKLLLALLCLLLLILLSFLLVRATIRKHIARAAGRKDTARGYKALMHALKRRHYPVDKDRPYELCSFFDDSYREYLDTVYKDIFSSGGLSANERKDAAEYVLASIKELPQCPKELRQKKPGLFAHFASRRMKAESEDQ